MAREDCGAAPVRYLVPGDVMLALAVALTQAFDGLKVAALAAQDGGAAALVPALQYMHARLDVIHETFLAVVGEHEPAGARPTYH